MYAIYTYIYNHILSPYRLKLLTVKNGRPEVQWCGDSFLLAVVVVVLCGCRCCGRQRINLLSFGLNGELYLRGGLSPRLSTLTTLR